MTNTRTKQQERTLYIILAAALAARLLLALFTEGYTYDMSCFVAWGDQCQQKIGPAGFIAQLERLAHQADQPQHKDVAGRVVRKIIGAVCGVLPADLV